MARFISIGLWAGVVIGVFAIAFIAGYAVQNDSGHTGWEPYTSFLLFVPLTFFGVVGLAARNRFTRFVRVSVCALAVGLVGIALIITLDRTDRLVEYERWIHRGMP